MKIDYKKIIFNTDHINFIIKAAVVTILFNIFTLMFFIAVINSFEKRIESKYSFEVFKNYYKGTISNPHAFINTADIYKLEGKPEKELEELKFALALYNNVQYRDNEQIQKLKQRIQILKLEEKNEN